MLKIDICIECKAKECCDFKDGIELYEFLKDYILEFLNNDEIEINLTRCSCINICNGPVVKVGNRVYTNVDRNKALDIIKNIALKKEV